MTREEAIQWLTDIKENITENWSHDVAIDMAIEALSAENSNAKTKNSNAKTKNSNQNSNGDLISRADAIKAVASITMSIHLSDVICDKLLALPSAEAVQTQAEKCDECIHKGTHKDKMTCKECVSAEASQK